MLVFVEVKARTSRGFGGALAAVTPRKQRQVIAMAQRYMARVRLSNPEMSLKRGT